VFGGQIKAPEIKPGMSGNRWIFNPYRMPECDDRKNSLTQIIGLQFGAASGGLIQIRGVNVNCWIRPKAVLAFTEVTAR
jgi:hypothetical protein